MLTRLFRKNSNGSVSASNVNAARKCSSQKRKLVFQAVEDRRMFVGLAGLFEPAIFGTTAIASGDWTNPAIWSRGVPRVGADIEIGPGVEVTVSTQIPGQFNFVNIEGTLSFDPNVNTRLRAETLRVENFGRLEVGTAADPVDANRTAEIVFSRYRATDRGRDDDVHGFDADDVNRVGLGLLVEPRGQLETAADHSKAGSLRPATGDARARDSFATGSRRITVLGDGSRWRIGDEISIAPTQFARDAANQTETVRIRNIRSAGTIQGQPAYDISLGRPGNHTLPYRLRFDHRNFNGQATHVANLTRNIVFRSDDSALNSPTPLRRGHIMSHSQDVQIRDAEFRDLGRTDKTRLVEDGIDSVPIRAQDGTPSNVIVPGTRDGLVNQRGRYAIHFHRTLDVGGRNPINDWNNLAIVSGSVVNGSPGWGFVNHSSGVDFVNNVAVGVVGSAFVSESGNEIGHWRDNVAIKGDGNGSVVNRVVELAGPSLSRKTRNEFRQFTQRNLGAAESITTQQLVVRHGDLARTGEGFWIQSPGLVVTDNVAAGFDGRGFAIYNQGLYETDREEEVGFRVDLINWDIDQSGNQDVAYRIWDDPAKRNDPSDVRNGRAVVQNLGLNTFENNTAYASYVGLQLRFQSTDNRAFAVSWDNKVRFSPGTQTPNNFTNREGFLLGAFTSLRNEIGVTTSYITNATFQELNLLNDGPDDYGFAMLAQQVIQGQSLFENLTIRGYNAGIDFGNRSADFVSFDPDVNVTDSNRVVRFIARRNNPGRITQAFGLSQLDTIRNDVFVDI